MLIEKCCQSLLKDILPKIDGHRSGAAIEIGVGTFAFYCKLFDKLNFKSVAVEPFPCERLLKMCWNRKIKLIRSCVSRHDNPLKMYMGKTKGKTADCNFNSLRKDWWGVGTETKYVNSKSLKTLISIINAKEITCIKIDVEGVELELIEQLNDLPDNLLPRVVMFEFGGGFKKKSKEGGWKPDIFEGTIRCLEILNNLDYKQLIVVDDSPDRHSFLFDFENSASDFNSLFDDESKYGNIIAIRDNICTDEDVKPVCQFFSNNEKKNTITKIKESPWKRLHIYQRKVLYSIINPVKYSN